MQDQIECSILGRIPVKSVHRNRNKNALTVPEPELEFQSIYRCHMCLILNDPRKLVSNSARDMLRRRLFPAIMQI